MQLAIRCRNRGRSDRKQITVFHYTVQSCRNTGQINKQLLLLGICSLSAKIDEFKESYRNAVNNGSYPAKIYYKFKEDNFTIDVTTFNYNEPVEAGYFSANFFGTEQIPTDKVEFTYTLTCQFPGIFINNRLKEALFINEFRQMSLCSSLVR